MKKIKYNTDRNGKCIKKCPFGMKKPDGDIVKVGSIMCSCCNHSRTGDATEDFIVLCNHPKDKNGN